MSFCRRQALAAEVCGVQKRTRAGDRHAGRCSNGGIDLPSARVRIVERATAVAEGVTLTGPIPRVLTLEDTGGPFYLDAACTQPDPLVDDQAVFLEADGGLVVILGCGHGGVINTLRYVRQLACDRPILAVLGGRILSTLPSHAWR